MRSTRSFHIRYLVKDSVASVTCSVTSQPLMLLMCRRTVFQMPATSMPEASCGSSPSNSGIARSKSCFSICIKRRIEAGLVLVQRQPKPGAHALAFELHGNEDQRRTIRAGAVLRRPFQEAEAQIEDVGAALLEGEPGGPVEIGKSAFEFGRRRRWREGRHVSSHPE